MVIFALGVIGDVLGAGKFFHDGSRSGAWHPRVMAYWLMSRKMAWRAASFITSGAAKSGKPWESDGVVLHGRRVIRG